MINCKLALFSSTASFSCFDTVIYNLKKKYTFGLPLIPGRTPKTFEIPRGNNHKGVTNSVPLGLELSLHTP